MQVERTPPQNIRGLIAVAIEAADDLVVVMTYRSGSGKLTKRTVSPIRFDGPGRFTAFCFGREGVRTFYLGRCVTVQIQAAHDVIVPVDVRELRKKGAPS